MKKRFLSLLLVLIMVLGMFPMSAMATETNDTVYISVSFDGQYVNDKNDEAMAYIPVSLDELQAIDLAEHNLSEYDYNGQVTALHLYIYTHETLMGEAWSDVDVQGGPGSIFFASGLFGFADCNLQYYCNGEYPAVDGWGVTADRLVLNDGDFFDIAAYTSWAFYSDSAFGFHYFLDNDEITHEYAATAGEALTVTLGRGASYMGSGSTVTKVADYTVSYGTAFGTATGTVTTNTDGQAEITFAEAGTYYLWVDGGYGAENPQDIVSAPGCAKVIVTAPACTHETWNPATCTTPKTCADCGATEGEADPDAHNYVDGTCEYCGEAEPVSYPFMLTVGSETLTITDLGTTDTCSKTSMETKEMSVTVPAGTTAVTVSSVNNSIVMMYPDHGDQQIARDNGSVNVSIGADSYLCLTTVSERILYHIYIEFAPCETHDWNDATCSAPKTCAACGATEGEADPEAHSYVNGTCEHCGAAEPVATPSYTIKLSEAEQLTAGLNYFISVPAEVLGKDIIFDFGSGTISGMMCQRHCSKRNIHTAGEGSTLILSAETVAAHLCNETRRAEVAEDFDLYLTEGSQMFAFYWWTTANLNGSYIYIEILPAEEECAHETWNDATCTTPKTCANCGETEGEADPEAHSYVNGTCEHCGAAEPAATPSYTIKLSEAEELTAGLNYFISVPAEVLGKDIIFDFGSGTISGMMCQRHCSKRNIHTAGEGSTLILSAETVAAHLCNETRRAEVAEDFDLYLTEGSQMFAFYWWTTANLNGSYIYIEILPAEEECAHETWNDATCTTPKTCANCGETEGEADPEAHSYVNGTCEHCGAAEPVATPSYTIKLSEAEELTAGLNYFISVPAEALGKDIIFDFGSGTISGMMCQRHCSQRNIHTAGEGSTLILSAETVAAHLCNESQRAKVASDFNLYLTEGSQMFAFYWWTTANLSGSYIYIEILPAEDAGGGDEEATYTVTLPTNNVGFSVRATSSPTVTSGGEFSFKLNIYDDYKKSENFKVLANGVELTSSGDTYTITNITANQTVTVEGVVEKTLAEKNVTVIAPAGSVVSSGAFHSYFKYDFVEPLQNSTLEDGRVQYIVPATSGTGGFIRVQNPNGVTYWDFGDLTIGKVFDITDEMLFIGSTEYTKDTVYANYEKNGHDTASLYLTANAQGWLDMDTGDTHSLNVFRNWIPVSNSTSNTGVSLPDVTYTVVDVNGNPSDVVTVTPDTNNSCYADIKAEKAGTAIILVTYDAVYNADGEGGKQFSAIWPENTGVIVVTVDAEDADIQTNITVNETANAGGKQILDVEHDILFYVGNAGAEYSFKPEDGCTVTISRSTVGNEMTFNGFTNEGVTVAADGTVTLSGLTTGAHIVKVEKDGKAAYQVIRAREVSYKLTHSDGTEVTAGNPAQPGETITVQFSKLIDPMGKLSGVYNAKFGFRYVDEADTVISINSSSAYGEYYFGSNPVRQRFTVTVPTEWDKETYTLTDGSIMLGGWGGSFGDHRSTTYMEGKESNLNASGTGGYASVLPDVVIPVYTENTPNTYTVTLPTGTTYTVIATEGSTSPVVEGGSYSFTVTIVDGWEAGENFAVKANDVELTAVEGIYTIENITADQTVTVEGVVFKSAGSEPEDQITLSATCTNYAISFAVTGATVKSSTATANGNGGTLSLVVTDVQGNVHVAPTISDTTDFTTIIASPVNLDASSGSATAEMAIGGMVTAPPPQVIGTWTINVVVQSTPEYTVTLPTETTGYTVTATESSASPVTKGGSYSFTVAISEGYEAGEDFAVKANDVELTAVEGVYTIENITADQTVTVEGVVEKQAEPARTWQEVMAMTQTYLTAQAENTAPIVGTNKGEWMVLGLARNGVTADFMDTYYENVKTYVTENIYPNGRLHDQKSTDNSRVILGLTAIGKDVTDVAGYNLLKGLSDLNYVKTQGINGPVFALIALDSKDYPTADNATATREALVEYILSNQLTDGGWALDGRNIDDMTPMAVQALAPYYDTNAAVRTAVDKALIVMETMSATPETYAQMIVALSALGIDCETDERFANVMDNMLSFALENGSFEKGKGSGTNQMSTEQCFYAMVAYNRFKNGQTALYDMSDLKDLHTVEILPCENGSVTVSKSSAMTGETITVTVAPDLGYQISKLTMNDAELKVTDNRATFIMPDETAILEATFVKAEASAQAVAQAMTDLEVKDAEEETYDAIADIKKAYSKLTAAEKLEIADEYRAFQSKVKQFEAYLKAHIDDAVDELEYFFDDLDEDDYSKQVWKKIEDLYEEALEAVKAARFEEEVYELLEAYLEELEEAAAGELEVTFRLIGDWKHDDGVSGHDEYVTWIETTEYNMPAGSTIYDLFIKAIDDFDLNQKGASKNYVESIQAPDILGGYWIGEFDNGPNSGWMYTINGDHPGYGLKEQDLEDGDEVIWHYVDDYTLEERKPSSKYYERWLEADDISPETWVKRNLDKIVTVEGKGEVKPELKYSHIGKDVKFSFTPAEGWVIKNVYVDGKDKGAIETYTYKDLAMDARIEVVFAQNVAFQMNFVDVPEAEWFYDDVYFAVSNGLFNGIDEFTFAPGASMTRAMLVTVLYRLEGQPAVTGGSAFADAAAGQWYTDAVIWATRNGIVNGYDNGKFGTGDNVTREQMATILYRYAQNCGYDTTARADLNGYTDAAKISSYAQEAMSWANAMGLINGRTYNTLAPTGTATRAEVAAIFHRFVENIVK